MEWCRTEIGKQNRTGLEPVFLCLGVWVVSGNAEVVGSDPPLSPGPSPARGEG